ncbi:hypothetical protein EVAR_63625_1 [Eumeta japonica]|uniref:Secreted protein n=1 Tax=Eumeta variegata TaxID=151549 RepID=A0A4C1ZP29_EUMVA|nr:hypothetical protein EVAR_63625_1 [Eumeta japonica]
MDILFQLSSIILIAVATFEHTEQQPAHRQTFAVKRSAEADRGGAGRARVTDGRRMARLKGHGSCGITATTLQGQASMRASRRQVATAPIDTRNSREVTSGVLTFWAESRLEEGVE